MRASNCWNVSISSGADPDMNNRIPGHAAGPNAGSASRRV